MAGGLLRLGINPGDKVAVWLPNRFVKEYPMTASGKVQKFTLQEMGVAELKL